MVLTVLGGVLRLATLDVQSLSGDEGVTSALVRMSFGDMLSTIPDTESTPPLYYALAWAWTRVFGHGEMGMRSLSALFGAATIPVVYAAGRALASARVGAIAAGLTAVSPLLVWYSQEARAYALLVLLAALSLLLMARVLERTSARRLTGWAAICALALATHYYAGFLVAAEAAWLVWRVRPQRPALVAAGAVGLVGLALLPLALDQRSTGNFTRTIESVELGQRVKEVPKKLLVGEQGTPGDYGQPAEALKFAAGALALLAAALLLARARGREREGGLAAAAIGGAAAGVPLAMALAGFDYFAAYLLVAAWVPLVIAAAAGFAALDRAEPGEGLRAARRRGVPFGGRLGHATALLFGATLLVVTISVPVGDALRRPDFRGAARSLGHSEDARVVVATPDNSFAPLDHYLRDFDPLPPGGAAVREVALLGMHSEDESFRRRPGHRPTTPPAPGFELIEVVDNDRFTLLRFRAPRPVRLTVGQLAASRLGDTTPTGALQR